MTRKRILEEVQNMPAFRPFVVPEGGVTARMVSEELNMSYSKAKTRLDILADAGKLRREKIHNRHVYFWKE